MPTNTWTPVATATLTGTDSEIVFSSIPATYRDLILVANYTCSSNTGTVIFLRFNSDSSNGTYVGMRGNGSTTASGSGSSMLASWSAGLSTSRTNAVVQIMDYSATDKHKTALVRCDDSTLKTEAMANRWASTSAVTSVSLTAETNSFASGSTFSLYGVIA
jgi:hypothetical protein